MIVDKTKQAAERWSSRSKIKALMTYLEHFEEKIALEIHRNNVVEASYCSVEDDEKYVLDYEKTNEMDSAIMTLMKEKVYYA
jgi:hypothetical protein